MRSGTRAMAVCAMTAALSVVVMLLGAVLELGMYAAPLFAGLFFIPVGWRFGRKYHVMLYVVSSVLCFLLVPNVEENLMLAGLFGWYPIVRPWLQKLPKFLRLPLKLLVFNAAVIAVEALVLLVLVPESLGSVLLWIMLALGNVTFLLYDILIPRMTVLLDNVLKRG